MLQGTDPIVYESEGTSVNLLEAFENGPPILCLKDQLVPAQVELGVYQVVFLVDDEGVASDAVALVDYVHRPVVKRGRRGDRPANGDR